ncbi:hypothetical protein ACOMHN_022597 [Nucella lapillus]
MQVRKKGLMELKEEAKRVDFTFCKTSSVVKLQMVRPHSSSDMGQSPQIKFRISWPVFCSYPFGGMSTHSTCIAIESGIKCLAVTTLLEMDRGD